MKKIILGLMLLGGFAQAHAAQTYTCEVKNSAAENIVFQTKIGQDKYIDLGIYTGAELTFRKGKVTASVFKKSSDHGYVGDQAFTTVQLGLPISVGLSNNSSVEMNCSVD